jgi:hypothetical protein
VSAFGIVRDVTSALAAGLAHAFDLDPLTSGFSSMIFTASPASDGAGENLNKFSLWPYRITRDEFVSNEPLIPIGPSLLGIPPLMVDVWYLATPMSGSGDNDQLLLEKTLEYVYDVGPLSVGERQTTVTFETPGSDELLRLWSAMDIPYALSCIFTARSIAIDSLRPPQRADRVVERYARYERAPA